VGGSSCFFFLFPSWYENCEPVVDVVVCDCVRHMVVGYLFGSDADIISSLVRQLCRFHSLPSQDDQDINSITTAPKVKV
jgi:hypothetical protein